MAAASKNSDVAQVDFLVDENGQKLDVPDDTTLKIATDVEQTVGGTGPTAWWRYGLVALLVVVVILLALQFLGGNRATDVIPGTPTAAPQGTNQS
jgi:hypothetical protein